MDKLFDAVENRKITNNCKGKNCSNCGECCTDFIPLTKNEVKNIKAYIKKNNIKENVYVDEEHFDLRCPFFLKDSDKHCAIYPVRPEICRIFKCCQSAHTIADNQTSISIKADYNRYYSNSYHKTFVSLHNLFYNNTKYELDALYLICNREERFFRSAVKECLTDYKFSDEEEVK